MTKSLLGPFIQIVPNVPVMREWLHRVKPNVVLTMESGTAEAILGRRPADWNPIVIGRPPRESELTEDPRVVAQRVVDSEWGELCDAGIITHMMLINELNPHDGRWQKYVSWQRLALDELSWGNIKYLAGSWSVGQPDELYYACGTPTCGFSCAHADPGARCPNCGCTLEKRIVYWDHSEVHTLMKELAAAGGLLGLHQYNAPSMWDPRDFDPPVTDVWDPTIESWRILRHRMARWQLLDFLSAEDLPDFVISECGLEAGAVPWPIEGIREGELAGWKSLCTGAEYMDGLQWYDFQCRNDPYVRGLVVYIMGTYAHQADGSEGDWVTHDVWDVREMFGSAIRNPLLIEEEPEPEPPGPEPIDDVEDWIVNELMAGGWAREYELPFVPTNFIEALGLHMGWVPVSDEVEFWPLEGTATAYLKVFVAPVLGGGYCKKIVWWYAGDWENYKVITDQLPVQL